VLLTLTVILMIISGLQAVYAQSTPTPAITSTATQTNTPVNRQTATATLRVTGAPFIVSTAVEPAFPAVVMLQVRIDVPLERVRSATVHVYQAESGLDITAEIDLTDPEVVQQRGELGVISYPWRIDPATAPKLFSYVNFDWTVSLRENVTANALSGFTFQDIRPLMLDAPITEWRRVGNEGDTLQLYTHNELLSLGTLQTNTLRVLDKLRQQTGLDLRYKIIIYDPGYKFCDGITGPDGLYVQLRTTEGFYLCKPEDAVNIYRAQGFHVIERATSGLDQLQGQLSDLMVREAYRRLWRSSQPPAWFREGLFQLYQPSGQLRALQIARDASRANRSLPLSALQTDLADLADIDLWRSQSYLMITFLASRYGADAPFTLAANLSDIYTFNAALAALYNTTEAQVYADWQRWLFTGEAEAAVNWTPYLGLTPTRTGTPSSTLTRSPTSSIPTETRTPRVEPTNPPLVTFTNVPPTLTNTPRPPGSLRSPTPRPTPMPEGPLVTLTRSPLLLIVAVAGLVIVVALVLGLVLRRRR
jgi:hypothetical protein